MLTDRSPIIRLLLLAALALLPLTPLTPLTPLAAAPSNETPGPAFVDWKRGVEKQNNAARDARREIEAENYSPKKVLAFFADDSGYVRDAVFEKTLESASDDQILALAGGLLHSEPLVAENVAELLGRRKLAAAGPLLEKAIGRSKFTGARTEMLWALGECDPELAGKTALAVLKKEKRVWEVRAEALQLAAAHSGEKGREAIDDALEDSKRLPMRIAALHALRSLDPTAAVLAAQAQLQSPPKDKKQIWGPRIELIALQTLALQAKSGVAAETWRPVIDHLIESAEEATGRGRTARFETLAAITGEDLPSEVPSWRSWWTVKRDSWEPGSPSSGPQPASGKEEKDGGTAVLKFHGIPVDSGRVTFLQDLSGGMDRNLAGESGGDGPTRLDHAKSELARVLGELDDRTWVNVITFASTYFAPYEQPQILKRARKKVVQFCRSQEIPTKPGHARGNVYDALAYATASPYVDTIYLVSEGAPTEGKFHDYDRFLRHYERWNRWYGVRVHVLLVAETGGRNRSFLDRLSKGTGGVMQGIETKETR